MSCPFVYINGTLNLVLKGKSYQVGSDHPSYGLVKKSLATASEDELLKLLDVETSMKTYVETESNGKAVVSNGVVYFNGKPVHNTISNRILQFMQDGLPFKHLLLFMENVAKNPSYRAAQELFDFLEHKLLPITSDGCFLGYKAVRQDFKDKYTGTIDNSIGSVVTMERCSVDDERANECSKGLHVGTLEYAAQYGRAGDHMLIVKVNPRDAVSVPKDYSFQKLRTCRYEVIGEYTGELTRPLYTAKAEEVNSPVNDDNYDWDWADEDYDDEEVCEDCGEYVSDCWCDEAERYDEDDDDADYYNNDSALGYKPNGCAYHNKRDSKGRFAK
jgi:hypothetical protein